MAANITRLQPSYGLSNRALAHKRRVGAPSLPEPRPRVPRSRSLLCASHTNTRVQIALVTHTARVRASPATHVLSHGNTRSNVPCKNGVLASLATGSASAGALHAHLARTLAASALATSAARAAHASPTRCTCHAPPPLSRVCSDDNEWHEADHQGRDERREGVRATRVRPPACC